MRKLISALLACSMVVSISLTSMAVADAKPVKESTTKTVKVNKDVSLQDKYKDLISTYKAAYPDPKELRKEFMKAELTPLRIQKAAIGEQKDALNEETDAVKIKALSAEMKKIQTIIKEKTSVLIMISKKLVKDVTTDKTEKVKDGF